MFNARELLLIHAELDYIKYKDPEMQALCDKVHLLYRHQEMHEIMQEFLGVSKSYMLRMSDFDPVDVSGVPKPNPKNFATLENYEWACMSFAERDAWEERERREKEMQNAACQLVYEGPNYRSGVQGEKFRRLMPQPVGWMLERKKTFDEWQENCPDYDEGCITCVAWRLFLETGRCPTYDEANAALPASYR